MRQTKSGIFLRDCFQFDNPISPSTPVPTFSHRTRRRIRPGMDAMIRVSEWFSFYPAGSRRRSGWAPFVCFSICLQLFVHILYLTLSRIGSSVTTGKSLLWGGRGSLALCPSPCVARRVDYHYAWLGRFFFFHVLSCACSHAALGLGYGRFRC